MFIKKTLLPFLICFTAVIVFLISFSGSLTYSMPPHPELREKIKSGEIEPPDFLLNQKKYRAKGIESPVFHPKSAVFPQGTGPTGEFKAIVLLVEFSDNASRVNAGYFDTLVFVDQVGTVRNYYKEVSYQNLDIITVHLPSSLGWYTAPQTYSYYVDGQYGFGDYPRNAQRLVEDLVDLADPYVDFSEYDNDSDGYVDALMVVHAGRGAEYTGSTNDIWSHAWSTSYPKLKDGVYIYSYSIQPEYWRFARDMTLGVYCHELGHVFGLPDLYDYDYDSHGAGDWSLMALGSWNGSLGNSPAHPDAWSRSALGFADPIVVSTNLGEVSLPAVKDTSVIYKLWTDGLSENEYFLIENRQKIGYDVGLDGAGLLIWHVDEDVYGNDNQWYPGYTSYGHYKVALEQADGLWELEKNIDDGDAGDPYPGTTVNRSFIPCSVPNSDDYSFTQTYVEITNISNSASVMTVDLKVLSENSAPNTFSLISPPDYDTTSLPLDLDWEDSMDSNYCDTVLYELHYSTSQTFDPESTSVVDNLSASSYTLTSDSIFFGEYFWKVKAYDDRGGERWSDQTRSFFLFLRGDANNDAEIAVSDVVYIIGYLFKGGPAPNPMIAGDANCDGQVTISDAVYLIIYLFKGGPPPEC